MRFVMAIDRVTLAHGAQILGGQLMLGKGGFSYCPRSGAMFC